MTPNRLTRSAWLAPMVSGIFLVTIGAPSAAAPADTARHGWADGDSYILMMAGEPGRMMMHGSTSDIARARALRTGTEPLLYLRRAGKTFLVRDAATLRQAEAIFKPQAALGEKQAALGSRQAALGARQAELGARQAQLSGRGIAAGTRSEALEREQEELGRQQQLLGEQQGALGEQQGRLGREQERLGREARGKFRALVDDALRRGLAHEVS